MSDDVLHELTYDHLHGFCGCEVEKVPCPYCGAMVEPNQFFTLQVAKQTHWSPAEYETYCDNCMPVKYRERDPDWERDCREDR